MTMARPSEKQMELLGLIRHGGSIRWSIAHGTDKVNYFLEKTGDHRDLDGRTVLALDKRGLITHWGHGWDISESGRKLLDGELTGETKK